MSFYWYLDIAELDAVPTDDDDTPTALESNPQSFTVGPIEMVQGSKISVLDFVQRIQQAFDAAMSEGVCDTLYYIQARVRPIGDATQLAPEGNVPAPGATDVGTGVATGEDTADDMQSKIELATLNRELVIEYKIFNTAGKAFSILFRSGEHGFAGGLGAAQSELDGPPVADVTIINKPSIRAISAHYTALTSTITDKPPMPPDVEFVPYVGVNNKVMILFNSNAGEARQKPIILRDSDASFIAEEYFSQYGISIQADDLGGADTRKLQYRNDDPVRKYEIFRIGTKPTSYEDFRNFNLVDQPIVTKLGSDKYSTAVAYVDTLIPNKKYYYCARSIDIHNNISNPTAIFEIEMVDNRGQLFMKNRVFIFETLKLNYAVPGRRFLAIEPRQDQTLYDPNIPDAAPASVGMGIAPTDNILGSTDVRVGEGRVWGKKFKVRLTSTKTGRKIDLNVTFKNEGVENP